jgi:hypothetical protein
MSCDGYLFCESEDSEGVFEENAVQLYKFGDDIPDSASLVIFDVFLTPTIIVLKKYTHCSFIFVQHGLFSDLTIEKRNKKITLDWFKRSIKIGFRFLNSFGYSVGNVILLLNIMRFGPWSQRHYFSGLGLRINKGIFWNVLDFNKIKLNFPKLIKESIISLPPDFKKLNLEYCEKALPVYISQPLVEDGVVTASEYQHFIFQLQDKYGQDLLVIKHPRQKNIFSKEVFLNDIEEPIKTSKVIGHFSSLLLSVNNEIPVKYEAFGNSNIIRYSEYIEQSRNSLNDDAVEFEKVLGNE